MEEIITSVLDFGGGFLLGAILFAILGFLGGKINDPYFKVKIMNNVLKKNWLLLKTVSKDSKVIRSRAVNGESGVITVGNKLWTVEEGRIYRENKQNAGFFIKESKKVVYEEGVPTIYVDEDSIKPLSFEGESTKTIKPQEVGAVLNAWIFNQLAKGLLAMKQQNWLLYIAIGLLAVNIYLTFDNNGRLDTIEAKMGGEYVTETPNDTQVPQGGTLEEDKIIIKQGG